MNRTKIKTFATWARRTLLEQSAVRLLEFGIGKKGVSPAREVPGGLIVAGQSLNLTVQEIAQYRSLLEHHAIHGYAATVSEIGYTWFNRLSALRFLEVHALAPFTVGSSRGGPYPDLLEDAESLISSGELVGVTTTELGEWQRLERPDEVYRRLLSVQVRQLATLYPYLFDSALHPWLELFAPAGLLNAEGLLRRMAHDIPSEDWQDVEILGWLYQFYISERKDEVIGAKGKVSAADLPAATQLFTPHWIVRYMVENSLGRLWLEHHPESRLRDHMPYFLEQKEEQAEGQNLGAQDSRVQEPEPRAGTAQLELFSAAESPSTRSPALQAGTPGALTPLESQSLEPQGLRLLDPACGSGHILTYAFDLLFQIYFERGYGEREIPGLILAHNLYGLDIDARAVQLACFALTMKAVLKVPRLRRNPPRPQVLQVRPSRDLLPHGLPDGLSSAWADLFGRFEQADHLGSLIRVDPQNWEALEGELSTLERKNALVYSTSEVGLRALLKQARWLSERYTVVVANPPYMNGSRFNEVIKPHVEKNFSAYKSDLFSVFIIRCLELTTPKGQLGFMTPFVWMFISSYEALRKTILEKHTISSLVQLEYSGFDGATVPICAFTLRNEHIQEYLGAYVRLSEFRGSEVQGPKVLEAAANPNSSYLYHTDANNFSSIPGSPIAYWASDSIVLAFNKGIPLDAVGDVKRGMTTSQNDQFVRFWPEVSEEKANRHSENQTEASSSAASWFPYSKGGGYRKWYGYMDNYVEWGNNGEKVIQYASKINNSYTRTIVNIPYYFRPSAGFSYITSGPFSVRWTPSGCIYDSGGPGIFSDEETMKSVLSFMNSKPSAVFLELLNPTINLQIADVVRLPFIKPLDTHDKLIQSISVQAIKLSRTDWDNFETSWDFNTHPLTRYSTSSLEEAFGRWEQDSAAAFAELRRLEEDNNRYWIAAYGLQDELSPEVPDAQITIRRADRARDLKSLVSYAVGCVLGRYSLGTPGLAYAGGDWDPAKYGALKPAEGGMVPVTLERYFEDDLGERVLEWLRRAYGPEHLGANLEFLASGLGGRASDSPEMVLRRYLVQEFASDHIQTYKKRPIYWLFSSGKRRAFGALVYLHRYAPDTVARLRTDYLLTLQGRMDAELERMEREKLGATPARRRELEPKIKNVRADLEELRSYQLRLQEVADRRTVLDLDDGVAYNYSRFKGVVYEGADLKMADLEKKAQWKLDLLEREKGENEGVST